MLSAMLAIIGSLSSIGAAHAYTVTDIGYIVGGAYDGYAFTETFTFVDPTTMANHAIGIDYNYGYSTSTPTDASATLTIAAAGFTGTMISNFSQDQYMQTNTGGGANELMNLVENSGYGWYTQTFSYGFGPDGVLAALDWSAVGTYLGDTGSVMVWRDSSNEFRGRITAQFLNMDPQTSVPEPYSIILLAAGLLGFGASRRKASKSNLFSLQRLRS